MRKFLFFGLALIAGVIFSCKTENVFNTAQYTGLIKPAGITTYQYGSHTLEAGDEFYALRSNEIDLSEFEQKKVRLWAEKIEGYPIDGGPVFLEVRKVELAAFD